MVWTSVAHPDNSIYYRMSAIVRTAVYSVYMVDAATCREFFNHAETHAEYRKRTLGGWYVKGNMNRET
jgi:hypothetical protein